jgi:hypothetical protein
MERRLAAGAVERAAQGLAVDGNHASRRFGEVVHDTQKAALELSRIQQPEHRLNVSWLGIPCVSLSSTLAIWEQEPNYINRLARNPGFS